MVLDEPIQKSWTDRLRAYSINDCIRRREVAKITIGLGGKPVTAYVGGVFGDHLWFAYGEDDKRNLLPSIQILPTRLIRDYEISN